MISASERHAILGYITSAVGVAARKGVDLEGITTRFVMAVRQHGHALPGDGVVVTRILAALNGEWPEPEETPIWVRRLRSAAVVEGPGLVALCQQLRDDEEAPPAVQALARRALGTPVREPARARSSDPQTSKVAAERIRPTIRRPGSKVHRILRALGDHRSAWIAGAQYAPAYGLTSVEIERRAGVTEAHKRTSELLTEGLVEVVRVYDAQDALVDLVRDGGRVLRITAAGREELARLNAADRVEA